MQVHESVSVKCKAIRRKTCLLFLTICDDSAFLNLLFQLEMIISKPQTQIYLTYNFILVNSNLKKKFP